MSSRADIKLSEQMNVLYEDYKDLTGSSKPFGENPNLAPFDSPMEDYNASLSFGFIISDFKISRAKKRTPEDLLKAIRENDMITLFRAIQFGKPNLKYRDSSNRSALDWAILYDRPVAVNILLKAGVSPNDYNHSVGMPLLNAIERRDTFYGEYTTVKLLLAAGANIYETDNSGENAIMKMIKYDMGDLLFDKVYSSDIKKCPLTITGDPILIYAARYGNNNTIKKMLNINLNMNDKTTKQETILHILASRYNKETFIQQAIEKGVDVNAVDILGNTALHYACEKAEYENVKLLLDAGALPLMTNYNKETPKDKLNQTTSSDYKSIAKISNILTDSICATYQKMSELTQKANREIRPEDLLPPREFKICNQKPFIDLRGNSDQHTLE